MGFATLAEVRLEAYRTLSICNVEPGADFDTLNASQVRELLSNVKRWNYRKTTRKGCLARYFHAYLQWLAQEHIEGRNG
jgi:hypothetical protein